MISVQMMTMMIRALLHKLLQGIYEAGSIFLLHRCFSTPLYNKQKGISNSIMDLVLVFNVESSGVLNYYGNKH